MQHSCHQQDQVYKNKMLNNYFKWIVLNRHFLLLSWIRQRCSNIVIVSLFAFVLRAQGSFQRDLAFYSFCLLPRGRFRFSLSKLNLPVVASSIPMLSFYFLNLPAMVSGRTWSWDSVTITGSMEYLCVPLNGSFIMAPVFIWTSRPLISVWNNMETLRGVTLV